MPPSDEIRPEERPVGAVLSPPPPQPGSPEQSIPPYGPPAGSQARPGRARGRPAQPRKAAGSAAQQRATAALFLGLLSLFGLLAINNTIISAGRAVYIVAFTLVAGVVAAWFAATAIGRARHRGTALPHGSITALVIASLGIAISGVLVTGFTVLGKPLSAYSQCLSGANTVAAQHACKIQFTHAETGILSGLSPAPHG